MSTDSGDRARACPEQSTINEREAALLIRCSAFAADYLQHLRLHPLRPEIIVHLEAIPGMIFELDIEHAFEKVTQAYSVAWSNYQRVFAHRIVIDSRPTCPHSSCAYGISIPRPYSSSIRLPLVMRANRRGRSTGGFLSAEPIAGIALRDVPDPHCVIVLS
jgi:hypothetical protein